MGVGGLCLPSERSVWTACLHSSNRFNVILVCCIQGSDKKEHRFKFTSHMPSKMEQVNLVEKIY